jgi:hypothetical protein
MQAQVREGLGDAQVQEQQRCDAQVLNEAERKEITMAGGESVETHRRHSQLGEVFLARQLELELEPSRPDVAPQTPAPSARRKAV